MATIPNPLDLRAVALDPTSQYRVGLFTSAPPAGTYHDASALVAPADPAYAPQDAYGEVAFQDDNYVLLTLEKLVFSGANYLTNQTVLGYFVEAVFSDGVVLLGEVTLRQPVVLGPMTNNLFIEAEVEVLQAASDVVLNF
jgi:hypothetical protein